MRRCSGERKAGDAVGEGAVAVEVAAGGEVSGERRRALPHLAAAAGEAVVGGGEFLVADDPETLGEEEEQQKRGEALRPADVDARKCHAARSICKVCSLSRVSSFECIAGLRSKSFIRSSDRARVYCGK